MRVLSSVLFLFVFSVLFCSTQYGFSQENQDSPQQRPDLITSTLNIDIDTASYYELIAWCKRLDISQKGTIEELKRRLYEYYSIESTSHIEEKRGSKSITISSARTTEYFVVERIDENYIKLEGDVLLEMRDEKTGTVHKIEAQKIIFNETENLITAEGNLVYTIIDRGTEEQFIGESLSFHVDSLDGFFFEGTSKSERQIQEEEITFSYNGDTFFRSAEDVVTLSKGTITSSKPEDPYYQVKASKIWVLSPQEWGLRDAVLYIGRVPILYIPFFFHTGNKLFFHPSFGFRNIEGSYFQSTIYLFGEYKAEESSISFLQSEGESEGEYKKEIKGLFIRRTRPFTPEEKREYEYIKRTGSFVKAMFDIYTRLGFFTGLKTKIADVGLLKSYDLFFGLARSRNIFIDPENGSYVPYWYGSENEVVSYWNSSSFLGAEIPLRFGLDNYLSLGNSFFTLTLDAPIYSDPFFLRDFDRRDESIDWGQLLGLESEESASTAQSDSLGSVQNTLNWKFSSSLTLNPKPLQPYLQNANIRQLSLEMYWKSKESVDEDIFGLDSEDVGYVPESARTTFSFPERDFYYPESYLAPGFTGEVSGNLFEATYGIPKELQKIEKDEDGAFQDKKILPPWEDPDNGTTVTEHETESQGVATIKERDNGKAEKDFRVPELQPNIALLIDTPRKPYYHSLSYQVLPDLSFNSRMNSSKWHSSSDIDFSQEYSIFNTKGSSKLTYEAKIFDDYLQLNDIVTLSGEYQEHLNKNQTVEEDTWFGYKESDYNKTFLKVANDLSATTFPLTQLPLFSPSSIRYDLDVTLFQKKLSHIDTYNNPVFDDYMATWDKEFVTNHSLNFSLVFLPFAQRQTLQLQAVLPPLLKQFNGTVITQTGPFTTTVATGYQEVPIDENDDDSLTMWEWKPLSLTEKFVYKDFFSAEQYFQYSIKNSRWTKSRSTVHLSLFDNQVSLQNVFGFGDPDVQENDDSAPPLFHDPFSNTTSLRLWFFYGEFFAKKMYPISFQSDSGWIREDEKLFVPETLRFGIDASPKETLFWKNRIRLSLNLDTGITWYLNKFTDSLFSFSFGANFEVHQFLDLSIQFRAENNNIYRYFDQYTEITEEETINPFVDFGKSLNIFNMTDRRETSFNAKKISINLIHHLRDWDLTFEYEAGPELETNEEGYKEYEWKRSFSIFVQWNPIPEIRSRMTYDDETLDF